MNFALTILGNNSAVPAFGRNPTAQVLHTEDENLLIDCGEGTQGQMSKFKIKKSRISHIFISHMHGDHYFGLPGLLNSLGLLNHQKPVHLHGPAALWEILQAQFKASNTDLTYPLMFHALGEDGVIANTKQVEVSAFKVQHGIDCWGFLFKQKKLPRSVVPERAHAFGIPNVFFENLRKGENFKHPKGTIIPNEEVTVPNKPPLSYAFCADTRHDPNLVEKIKSVDLLYHETTYLKDQEEKATLRFHSTTIQAGDIAKKAAVKKLLIGHFSSKYEQLDAFLEETRSIFPNTELAEEGSCFKIGE